MSTRGSTAEQPRGRSPYFARRTAEWERSAANERRVSAILDQLPTGFVVFHNLPLPRPSTATVDHLVVSPLGVWLVDAHVFPDPVTIGHGRNADTLWTGRIPLRSALEASDWEAEKVGALIGRRVEPIMCVVAPSIPEPAFEFNGITICEPDHLTPQLLTPAGDPFDAQAVVETVRRVFGTEPATTSEPPTLAPAATLDRSEVAPYPARRVTAGARLHAIRRSVGFRVVVLVALGAAAVAFFPTTLGTWDAVVDGVGSIGESITNDDSDAGPTAVGAPAAPLPVRFVATCPTPGAGWELRWVWPGDLAAGATAYGIRVETEAGEIVIAVPRWDDPTDSPSAFRLDGRRLTTVLTDHVDADGTILTTTRQPFQLLADDC